MTHRNRIHADERLEPGPEHHPFNCDTADWIRPIAHDDFDAMSPRRLEAVRHRVDVGVDADADVLEIDDQDVDPAQHLCRWFARFAVERIHRHAPDVVARMPRLDHVVLDVRPEAVLRAEQRRQSRARMSGEPVGDVP